MTLRKRLMPWLVLRHNKLGQYHILDTRSNTIQSGPLGTSLSEAITELYKLEDKLTFLALD